MPIVATILSMAVLLKVGSRPSQLLFYAAQERMIAQNSSATNGLTTTPHYSRISPQCGGGCNDVLCTATLIGSAQQEESKQPMTVDYRLESGSNVLALVPR